MVADQAAYPWPVEVSFPEQSWSRDRGACCHWYHQHYAGDGAFDGRRNDWIAGELNVTETYRFKTVSDAAKFIEYTTDFFEKWADNAQGKLVTVRMQRSAVVGVKATKDATHSTEQ